MVRYLIRKPVAVLLTFIILLVAGLLLVNKVPVSLLPDIDVPQIVVRINAPNTPAQELEQLAVRSIRENLANIHHVENIESRTANHTAIIRLSFAYNTRMDLAYVTVNERLDRLTGSLPSGMERPQVMRINTSDIPVIRIQAIPQKGTDLLELSRLAETILKKRLEQIPGVSLVDLNGKRKEIISITPDEKKIAALKLQRSAIAHTIRSANQYLGNLSVKDGQYSYFIKLSNSLSTLEDIALLPVKTKGGAIIPLKEIAAITQEEEKPTGHHLCNGREGLVMTIQKQPNSRMNDLVPEIKKIVEQFSREYKQVDFSFTQDQTFLLDAGIDNLRQDLIYGAIFTILLLCLFLGNWQSALLMSISIPLSLIITFIFFYLFNISFNIISLSGLALGIGMLIDNSIVVLDSIIYKRKSGLDMIESSVKGTNDVMLPVISQVLTTVAVYAPLVLLSGMAGALVYDQSIALTISLGVSLLVAFILVPQLYRLFHKGSLKEDTAIYKLVEKAYHRMIHHILRRKGFYFSLTLLLMPLGFWIATKIPVSSLPKIERTESLLQIDWNDPVDAAENLRRMKALSAAIQPQCLVTEAETGNRQFLLQQSNYTVQKAELYFRCKTEKMKLETDEKIKNWLNTNYPHAIAGIQDAPNAFTQLFISNDPWLEARFTSTNEDLPGTAFARMENDLRSMKGTSLLLVKEPNIAVVVDDKLLALYQVEKETIEDALQYLFGTYNVSSVKGYGEVRNIHMKSNGSTLAEKMNSTVRSANGTDYPLRQFVSIGYSEQEKFITADRGGIYRSVSYDGPVPADLQQYITKTAALHGFNVSFTGQYMESRQQLHQLWIIFALVLLLLYFILALQYESLLLPILVMLTIPLGITGSMFLLWITGCTLDVMAVAGLIVILGLIVDDPILKIETLRRLDKKYREQHLPMDDKLLETMIHEAGSICLKPLLMVSLTTSIAMVPVLFSGGIGNELQKPLAIVIIGGLTIGTFFTTWFIPLAYWYLAKHHKKRPLHQERPFYGDR